MVKLLRDKNFFWNMVGITFNAFYPLFLVIFITRYDGISESGYFSFTFYLASLLSIISSYGGRIYQVSDAKGEYSDSNYVSLKFVSSFAMFVVSIIFCLFNHYDLYKSGIILSFLIYRMFESIADSMYGIMQKYDHLDYVGKSLILKTVLGTLLFIIFDIVSKNLFIASMSFIFSHSLIFMTYDRLIVNKFEKINIKFSKTIVRLLKQCFLIFAFSFFSILIMNTTRYAVDLNLSKEIQGYFGILIMPASIIALFAQFVLQPLLVNLSNIYSDKKYSLFNNSVNKVCLYLLGMGIPCLLLTYLIGSEFLSFIYGMDFQAFKIGLTLMVLAGIANAFSIILSMILTLMRKLKIQIAIYVFTFLFSIVISLYFTKENGIDGALVAFLFSMLFQFFLFLIIYKVNIKKIL
jgi:O-antigen/teichoic acid export membrane protein